MEKVALYALRLSWETITTDKSLAERLELILTRATCEGQSVCEKNTSKSQER